MKSLLYFYIANNIKEVDSSDWFKTVKCAFIKNHCKTISQNVVCSDWCDTLYPKDDSDESDSGSTPSKNSNYSESKKKKQEDKKLKIYDSTAGEALKKKHNENHM